MILYPFDASKLKERNSKAGGGPECMCVWCWLANGRGCSRGSIPQSRRVLVLCPLCMCALGAAPRIEEPTSWYGRTHLMPTLYWAVALKMSQIFTQRRERAARGVLNGRIIATLQNRSLLKSYLIWWFHLVFIIYNGWLGERRLDLEGRFYSSLWIERR